MDNKVDWERERWTTKWTRGGRDGQQSGLGEGEMDNKVD